MEIFHQLVDLFFQAIDIFLHIDRHLNELVLFMGPWIYVLLFLIIFCETGLVVTPFLPGDSLIFACGAMASIAGSPLNVWFLSFLLSVAAVLGDAANYSIGYWVGPKVFTSETSRLFNKKHLIRTQSFYEKYGAKTIVLARFVPIVRTFAPFVAGIGKMRYPKFAAYNVTGGVAWVLAFLLSGFYLGNVPTIKRNFHIVIVLIVLISVMPMVIEYLRARREAKNPDPRMADGAG